MPETRPARKPLPNDPSSAAAAGNARVGCNIRGQITRTVRLQSGAAVRWTALVRRPRLRLRTKRLTDAAIGTVFLSPTTDIELPPALTTGQFVEVLLVVEVDG